MESASSGAVGLDFLGAPNVSPKVTLEDATSEVAQLREDRIKIQRRPRARSEVEAALKLWLDGATSKININRMLDPDHPDCDSPYWPASDFGKASLKNAAGVMVWLMRPALEQELRAQLDEYCDETGITAQQRKRLLDENAKALLAAEMVAAELECRALAAGQPVKLQPDISGQALLCARTIDVR